MELTYRGIWLHPWDLIDAGVPKVLAELKERGFTAVSLAARYIEERQNSPGPNLIFQNPYRRAYVSEGSAVYWRPEPDRYAHLPSVFRPTPSRDLQDDVVKIYTEACKATGLRSVLWLPVLRWDQLVRNDPQYSVVDIYGSPVGHKRLFLCPTHPTVRQALRSMVKELAERYEFDELELDFIRYPEVNSTYGSPLLALALSPCFCEHCQQAARRTGLELEDVRRRLKEVVEWHVRFIGSSGYCVDHDYNKALQNELARRFLEDALLRQWLSFRAQLIASLVKELVEEAHRVRPELAVTADLYPPSGAWELGQDFRELGRLLDGVKIMVYIKPFKQSLCRISLETRIARGLIGNKQLILGLASWPPTSPADIRAQYELARRSPIDGISFYCFGWTPSENFDAISDLWNEQNE